MKLEDGTGLLKRTFLEWKDDDALQWGAALSYYTALALAPLLMLLLTLAGVFFDEGAARQQLVSQLEGWMGAQGGELARAILDPEDGGLATGLGSAALLAFGAAGVFGQLQKALNHLWEVEPRKGGVRRLLRSRILGVAMVLALGLLLLAAVVIQAAVTALAPDAMGAVLGLGGSLAVFTVLFAGLFKVLPDVDIHWREVWAGAGFTAVLFVVGQGVIGLYLGRSSPGSAYGAAGSLVAVLVWIYYSAQTFFLGAEFTQVWARTRGRSIEPSDGARRTEHADGDGGTSGGGDGIADEPELPEEEPPPGATYP